MFKNIFDLSTDVNYLKQSIVFFEKFNSVAWFYFLIFI